MPAWLKKESIGPGVQCSLRMTFCYRNFLLSDSKASDANIDIIAHFVKFVKTPTVRVDD